MFKGLGELLTQPFGLEKLPLVEVGAIGQGKTSEKVIAVKVDRFRQGIQTIGIFSTAICHILLKLARIEPNLRAQGNCLPINVEPITAKHFVEAEQLTP